MGTKVQKTTQPTNASGETFPEWKREAEHQLRGLGWTITGIFYGLIWGGSKDAWMANIPPHEWAMTVMAASPAALGMGKLATKTQALTWGGAA